jgi:hypothetical protein
LASCQSQLIQYHPNLSTIDEAGETLTKKQKVKHAASMHTFHGAASGRYIQEKISPECKTEHEVSNANDKSQRGHTWNQRNDTELTFIRISHGLN